MLFLTMSKLIVDKCDLKIGDKETFTWYNAMIIVDQLNKLNYKGHNNWRLPTKEELNYLYQNKEKIGGFSTNIYWNSTEYNATRAWTQYTNSKYDNYRVRCVRSI